MVNNTQWEDRFFPLSSFIHSYRDPALKFSFFLNILQDFSVILLVTLLPLYGAVLVKQQECTSESSERIYTYVS